MKTVVLAVTLLSAFVGLAIGGETGRARPVPDAEGDQRPAATAPDIVQVEFSGPGTITINLNGATGPAVGESYNQAGVAYM